MAQFYKVLKADPLGEAWTPDQPGAKPIQSYWCQLEGVDRDVSIGKQVGNTLTPGQHVYGDLVYAKSQKGTEYWKFKSQQVPEGVQRPADTPAQAQAQAATGADKFVGDYIPSWFVPFGNILIDLQKDMKLLKGDEPVEEPTPEPEQPQELFDEETKKTIDEIFTPPEVPEGK